MNTSEIIRAIEELPTLERIYIVERTIRSIRKSKDIQKMEKAASALLTDYESDYELTSMTKIDMDDFYEAK
ncbi:hypothetical protein [Roseimarinus sediminis]|uniref:hypothetical protein n=1 Tax=Roseimarinus sediminis TaxID=1610899 RepID=UPI003D1B3947